jgi:hypothetical protein
MFHPNEVCLKIWKEGWEFILEEKSGNGNGKKVFQIKEA